MWDCHHRLETHFSNGEKRPERCFLTRDELEALDMYYNRPPEELAFLTKKEHAILHLTGHKVSKETKEKISKNNSSKKESTRKLISERTKEAMSDPKLREKLSKTKKDFYKNGGTVWNKGKTSNTPHDPKTGKFISKYKE